MMQEKLKIGSRPKNVFQNLKQDFIEPRYPGRHLDFWETWLERNEWLKALDKELELADELASRVGKPTRSICS